MNLLCYIWLSWNVEGFAERFSNLVSLLDLHMQNSSNALTNSYELAGRLVRYRCMDAKTTY
jgi:hypothetical protein